MAKFSTPVSDITSLSSIQPRKSVATKYGPQIVYQPHIAGFTPKQLFRLGLRFSAFGGSALLAIIYFASGIPRLQNDILVKLPGMRRVYEKVIDPADNPF